MNIRRPLLLDGCCCQGGASRGYYDAGFDLVGVDTAPQPRYPFEFHQADILEFLADHGGEFDFIHVSPPCQAYSTTWRLRKNEHPDLVGAVRDLLVASGKPWVIENVPGAPLINPVLLCGAMFGLRTYRHRLFEVDGFALTPQPHPRHVARTAKLGRPPREGEFLSIVGNFSGVGQGRDVMGMPWANRDGLREAIPPAYTAYIGSQYLGLQEMAA